VLSQQFLGWFELFGSFRASASRFFVLPSARKKRFSAVRRHHGPDLLPRNYAAHQVSHAHQVVGRAGKREDPIDFQRSAMPYFAHQRNGLQPAKTFFDALPLLLADDIAPLPRGAAINGAAASSPKVLRHAREVNTIFPLSQ
jgi:hypothetical protein